MNKHLRIERKNGRLAVLFPSLDKAQHALGIITEHIAEYGEITVPEVCHVCCTVCHIYGTGLTTGSILGPKGADRDKYKIMGFRELTARDYGWTRVVDFRVSWDTRKHTYSLQFTHPELLRV